MQRAFLRLVCALLLFAQQAGLVHAVLHAAHQGQAQERRLDERSGESSEGQLSRVCALDAALSQVLGGAPLASHSFAPAALSTEISSSACGAFVTLESPAPRSRGPPSLL